MTYKVLISDSTDYRNNNTLIFYFGTELEKAKNFCKEILKISDYYVEIIPILEDGSEE